ncbi:hypothetical protein [Streptomyces sp. NPDC015131]|uniref:wHTH domain-containing protein n=1 Tax=Streptomyces sp. NPDC015131 TaxID=3364941 RepID=UPI0036FD7DEA
MSALVAGLPEDIRFTPAEAAVLALSPALFHGFRVRLLSRADRDLGAEWVHYPRLRRQTDTATDPRRRLRDRRVVEGWVLHRTRAQPGDAHKYPHELQRFLNTLLVGTDELTDVFGMNLVGWLFRAMQHGGGVLADPPWLTGRPGAAPDVRPETVGLLLCVAQIMALDRYELPAVLVEHIGGSDRIGLAHVRRTIENARWEIPAGDKAGGTLRLVAECGHQALMVALQERTKSLDGLLCSDLAVPGLSRLPSRASGVEVRPERDPVTGKDKFFPVATRFGLDGTRVRELLVGEQLYEDRHLAVRELYQNAMDACQVRRAREAVLTSADTGEQWAGRIELRQGVQGNRRYLDCFDNGSGMGRGELLYSFAQGGVRLAHLTSFQEEKIEWLRRGIPFQENSRFGIGVLSYFMLADEIEVITRKFKPDGTEGDALRVTIAGPDHLFQVMPYERDIDFLGEACGTRVRWWLRDDLPDFSCVHALRSVLGVAQFRTTASDGSDHDVWEPDEYRSRPHTGGGRSIDAGGTIVQDPAGEVFWCEHGGALLVDGILVEGRWFTTDERTGERRPADAMQLRGAVVNLKGRVVKVAGEEKAAPRLSVDRSHVVDDVTDTIFGLLRKKKAVLRLAASGLLTEQWLADMADHEPLLADAVVRGLAGRGAELDHGNGTADMARTGCFNYVDRQMRTSWLRRSAPGAGAPEDQLPLLRLPAHLALWRLAAHFPEDVRRALGRLCPDDLESAALLPARPSDLNLLLDQGLVYRHDLPWALDPPVGALHSRARALHMTYGWVVRRLTELGLRPTADGAVTDLPVTALLILTSLDADGDGPWLRPGEDPVSALNVLTAAEGSALTVEHVVRRAAELGYDTGRCADLLEPGPRGELLRVLLSSRLDGSAPWLRRNKVAYVSHIVDAAQKTGVAVAEIRAVLLEQGFILPDRTDLHAQNRQWVLGDTREALAGLPHMYRLAHLNGSTTRDAALRLAAYGFDVRDPGDDRPAPPHAEMLTAQVADGRLLPLRAPVTLLDLHRLAQRFALTLTEARDRLRSLAVDVPYEELPDDGLDAVDLALLSRHPRSGLAQGLDPRHPVPLAHVIVAAFQNGIAVEDAHARLARLGMTVGPLPEEGYEWLDLADEQRLARSWIPYEGPASRKVPLAYVMCLAIDYGWSTAEAAERLRLRGMLLAEPDGGVWPTPTERDRVLLSSRRDGQAPWLSFYGPVNTVQVVEAAQALEIPVTEARAGLLELGVTVSGWGNRHTSSLDDPLFRPLDQAARREVEGLARMVEAGTPLPAAYAWMVASMGAETVHRIAQRLRAAGIAVQEADYPDEYASEQDVIVLREHASSTGSWLPLDRPVDLEHLLVAAHRLCTTVSEVADRLRALGLTVAPVEETVREAWARVPLSD